MSKSPTTSGPLMSRNPNGCIGCRGTRSTSWPAGACLSWATRSLRRRCSRLRSTVTTELTPARWRWTGRGRPRHTCSPGRLAPVAPCLRRLRRGPPRSNLRVSRVESKQLSALSGSNLELAATVMLGPSESPLQELTKSPAGNADPRNVRNPPPFSGEGGWRSRITRLIDVRPIMTLADSCSPSACETARDLDNAAMRDHLHPVLPDQGHSRGPTT
jgi:hypothetical protein